MITFETDGQTAADAKEIGTRLKLDGYYLVRIEMKDDFCTAKTRFVFAVGTKKHEPTTLSEYTMENKPFPVRQDIDVIRCNGNLDNLKGMQEGPKKLILQGIDSFEGMPSTVETVVAGKRCSRAINLHGISTSIKSLTAEAYSVNGIKALEKCTNLQTLKLVHTTSCQQETISSLTNLVSLAIGDSNDDYSDLRLERLEKLTRLSVAGNLSPPGDKSSKIPLLPTICQMTNLASLDLYCTSIHRVTGLVSPNLLKLWLPDTLEKIDALPPYLEVFCCLSDKLTNLAAILPKTVKTLGISSTIDIGLFSIDPENVLTGSIRQAEWKTKHLEEYNRRRKCIGLGKRDKVVEPAHINKLYYEWLYGVDGPEYQQAVKALTE